jgi:hypothetical protein
MLIFSAKMFVIVKITNTLLELNLYLTEDIISQSFFYIGWNCLECIIN